MGRVLIMAVTFALGGCSAGPLFDTPSHQAAAFETVHTFYRPLAADAARAYLNAPDIPMEISELKVSVAPQPGDWTACVRAWKNGQMFYLAVFFRDRAVFETRRSILFDRCEAEQFVALAG